MMRRRFAPWAFVLAVTAGTPVLALDCREMTYEGIRYALCEVDPATEKLQLFLNDPSGTPYAHFSTIETALDADGQALAFAMNAGMYHQDRRPVGLYIEDGETLAPLQTKESYGNFGLLPNGVLCLTDTTATVVETLRYRDTQPACRDATQSGPMLVIDGRLHPRFLPDSTSRYIRNGVGTSDAGDRAVFVISRNPVTFHQFGSFFRDALGLPQALYFDGNVSRLHAPALNRSDAGFRMGPIVGLPVPKSD
ncbi:phosphodiester glycosidase family protein [Seohaeicola saemankumensis]|uniref:phosphodiester glycosidase family protein n=1 Tax=Seohaeicola saemankumensis TaxID=481181 RepID=UPI003AF35450|nr:phosphodiester glycosidase family protein [Seohaeicola saemankumensis]